MLRLSTSLAFVTGLALPLAHAILVAPGSPCSSNCGNVLDATTPDDMVCSQDNYKVGAGQVFSTCVECEMTSGYSNKDETDTEWMLYNLRYAVSYCLFGTPDNENVISTPCITSKACGPFRSAIEFKNMSSDVDSYDYCAVWPVTDHADFKGCTDCLKAGNQQYLANFVTTLQAGCEQQPVPGASISIKGNVFSHDIVNITAPSPVATVDPDWFDQGPLTLGAKVGIAFGGLAVVLAVLGFFIVWNGKRRRKAYLRNLEAKHGHNGWPTPHQGGGVREDMRETPVSQRPLRGWDDSPMSATTEKGFSGRYFSPYSSQYNSPVSAQDALNMAWPGMAHANNSMGLTVEPQSHWAPVNPAGAHVHSQNAESYEMHEVDSAGSSSSRGKQRVFHETPVLGHPGYGRTDDSPPRMYSLSDEEQRHGRGY